MAIGTALLNITEFHPVLVAGEPLHVRGRVDIIMLGMIWPFQ